MVVLFSAMADQLGGLASARNALLSALVKPRFLPPAPLPKRSLVSKISVVASPIQGFLYLTLHNMTSKAACHIKLCENLVREWVQDKTLKVLHVAGKTNLAYIFTKEMWDGMHFCWLRVSFMSCLSDFLSTLVLAIRSATLLSLCGSHRCSVLSLLWRFTLYQGSGLFILLLDGHQHLPFVECWSAAPSESSWLCSLFSHLISLL
jgi:hypothetical protein